LEFLNKDEIPIFDVWFGFLRAVGHIENFLVTAGSGKISETIQYKMYKCTVQSVGIAEAWSFMFLPLRNRSDIDGS
jgi:hypothetical protein